MRQLDRTDARILRALDENPDATVVALARRLDLARNTVQSRLRNLEQSGVLQAFSTRVRPEAVGRPVLAFVTLTIDQVDVAKLTAELALIPEIIELHATTGDGDLLARVVVASPADLHAVTLRMLHVPGVARTSTAMAIIELIGPRTAPLLDELCEQARPQPVTRGPRRTGARPR